MGELPYQVFCLQPIPTDHIVENSKGLLPLLLPLPSSYSFLLFLLLLLFFFSSIGKTVDRGGRAAGGSVGGRSLGGWVGGLGESSCL